MMEIQKEKGFKIETNKTELVPRCGGYGLSDLGCLGPGFLGRGKIQNKKIQKERGRVATGVEGRSKSGHKFKGKSFCHEFQNERKARGETRSESGA